MHEGQELLGRHPAIGDLPTCKRSEDAGQRQEPKMIAACGSVIPSPLTLSVWKGHSTGAHASPDGVLEEHHRAQKHTRLHWSLITFPPFPAIGTGVKIRMSVHRASGISLLACDSFTPIRESRSRMASIPAETRPATTNPPRQQAEGTASPGWGSVSPEYTIGTSRFDQSSLLSDRSFDQSEELVHLLWMASSSQQTDDDKRDDPAGR